MVRGTDLDVVKKVLLLGSLGEGVSKPRVVLEALLPEVGGSVKASQLLHQPSNVNSSQGVAHSQAEPSVPANNMVSYVTEYDMEG